jgi:hypothetical protein
MTEAVIRERLQRTVDILCEDAARVELWAYALNGLLGCGTIAILSQIRWVNETVKRTEQPSDGERRAGRLLLC